MKNVKLAVLLCLVMWAPFSVMSATAQSTNATVTGTVADSSGAILPGVTVTAQNVQTGVVTTTVTNESGSYGFPSLQPGTYKLSGELPGFQTRIYNDVVLNVAAQIRLNFELSVASVSSAVEVIAASESPMSQVTSTIGGVLNVQRVSDLPITDRNVLNLASTQAGVIGNNFAGNAQLSTATTRDGVNINGTRNEGVPIYTSVDLIEEVRVVTSPADAELGRGSGQIQLSTRSGTNQFHGSLFASNRNTALNANTWFNNLRGTPRSVLNRNQFGGRLGGPIVKNKTFFHFLYDGQRQVSTTPVTTTTLTQTARQGIFRFYPGVQNGNANAARPTVDLNGNPVKPSTATGDLQSVSVFGRDPARPVFDSTGIIRSMIDLTPLPNDFRVGDGLNTAGVTWERRAPSDRDQINLRVDQNFNQANRLTLNYTREEVNGGLYAASSLPTVPSGYNLSTNWFLSGTLTSTLTPRMVNQFVAGILDPTQDRDNRYDQQVPSLNGKYVKIEDFDENARRTFYPNGPVPFLVQPTLLAAAIGTQSPIYNQGTFWSFGDTLSISRGKHEFRMGFDWRTGNSNATDSGGNGGNVVPRGILGAGAVAVTGINTITGIGNNQNSAQNLLIDLSGSVSEVRQLLNVNDSQNPVYEPGMRRIRDFHQREWSAFFKDDLKLNSTISLNLGVRYDWYGVPWDKYGLLTGLVGGGDALWGISGTGWDAMYQPGLLKGSLTREVLVGKNSPHPEQKAYKDDWNNFAPAVGVTWSIPYFGKDKTVLRAGYSIVYPRSTNLSNVDTNVGAGTGTSAVATFKSGSYIDLTSVRLPLTLSSKPLDIIPLTDRAQTQRAYENGLVSAYIQNWNFSLQRELAQGFTFDIRYVGNKGTKLIEGIDLNEVNIFETGILDAFKVTQAGGDAPLFDRIFNGLVVNPGQAPVGTNGVTGSAALRQNSTTRAFLANNNVGGLANYLNTTNSFTNEAGGLLRNGRLPENYIVVNPQYLASQLFGNTGNSVYHALQLEGTKRFSRGWTATGNYTWSKVIGSGDANTVRIDSRDLSKDRRRLSFDRTHVLKANGTFELPFGPGKFLSTNSGFLNRLLERWQIGGILTLSSGSPLSITSSTATYNQSTNNTPVVLGAFPKDSGGVTRVSDGVVFFDGLGQISDPALAGITSSVSSASTLKAIVGSNGQLLFVNPSPGKLGTLGRNYLNGPSSIGLDLNLVKRIAVREGTTVEIRIDAIDALNHPNFGNPTTDINSTSFGRITSASGNRILVGNLRLTF